MRICVFWIRTCRCWKLSQEERLCIQNKNKKTEAGVSPSQAPTEELLNLEILQPENIKDTLHAYQMAKRCNEKRVMAQSVEWGKRGARLNDIAPGIIVTPLAVDEFNGPRGDFYKNMFAKCPAGKIINYISQNRKRDTKRLDVPF